MTTRRKSGQSQAHPSLSADPTERPATAAYGKGPDRTVAADQTSRPGAPASPAQACAEPTIEDPVPPDHGRATLVNDPNLTTTVDRVDQAQSDAASGSDGGSRIGLDARRRGWFWHWNSVVTQYAPLIGLKGVGLLNSYTVWTDRRDESPHRGYAFPSQQSEADFYGEDRAELITINKILVALDLIEIRKEMLTRVDERGRRWRVPHNLYRVKDRPDGVDLRAIDVICVAELARRDPAVFRYVRRVFSERFRPIDGDNVWHAILSEVRDHPTWCELRDRARAIEARASARTRAGHQTRNGSIAAKEAGDPGATPDHATAGGNLDNSNGHDGDTVVLPNTEHLSQATRHAKTSVATTNTGQPGDTLVDAAAGNTGSTIAVAAVNDGSLISPATTAAPANDGRSSVVGHSNTTYDQDSQTTTTTTTSLPECMPSASEAIDHGIRARVLTGDAQRSQSVERPDYPTVTTPIDVQSADDQRPDGEQSSRGDAHPSSRSGESGVRETVALRGVDSGSGAAVGGGNGTDTEDRRVVGARWLAADDQAASSQVESDVEGGGDERRAGVARTGRGDGEWRPPDAGGGGPLVDPGPLVISTFEAANDRRASSLERALLAELVRDADSAARAAGSTGDDWVVAAMREAVAAGSTYVAPKRVREIVSRWAREPGHAPSVAPTALGVNTDDLPADPATDGTADVRLAGGASGSAVWSAVLTDLAGVFERETFERLLANSRVTRYRRGTVEVRVDSELAADKLSSEYRGLVERHLNARLRRPASVRFEYVDPADAAGPTAASEALPDDSAALVNVSAADVEVGRQVWQTLLADLTRAASPGDLDRLAGVVILGQAADGALLLGATSPHARRLLEGRYRANVETSLAALFGQPCRIRVLASGDWSVTPAPEARGTLA